jgi:hypothetical protein
MVDLINLNTSRVNCKYTIAINTRKLYSPFRWEKLEHCRLLVDCFNSHDKIQIRMDFNFLKRFMIWNLVKRVYMASRTENSMILISRLKNDHAEGKPVVRCQILHGIQMISTCAFKYKEIVILSKLMRTEAYNICGQKSILIEC